MNCANEGLGVSFDLPDKITVRQQLAYYDQAGQTFEANWRGALTLIENWQCDKLPDPKVFDLDAPADFDIVQIIAWAGSRTARHMAEAGSVKKA